MKNIANAIIAEDEYVKLTLLGKQVNFVELLSEFGYTDFNEFQNDKAEYKLKSLKWDIVCQPKIDLVLTNQNIALQKPAFMYSIHTPETYAFVKTDYRYKENIESLGYKVIPMGYNSQNEIILSYDGDLRVYLIIPNTIDVNYDIFLHKISDTLNGRGLRSEVSDNDILVDGRKVCGSGMFSINGMLNIVYQINFTDHADEIENVCGRGSIRPAHIPQDIITPEELKDEFISWIKF